VYDDNRAACPAFPSDVYGTLSAPGCGSAVMSHDDLAASGMGRRCLYELLPQV
jgi:hypothetical protein